MTEHDPRAVLEAEVATSITEARARFRRQVETTLQAARDIADIFEAAVGDVDPELAFRGWSKAVFDSELRGRR